MHNKTILLFIVIFSFSLSKANPNFITKTRKVVSSRQSLIKNQIRFSCAPQLPKYYYSKVLNQEEKIKFSFSKSEIEDRQIFMKGLVGSIGLGLAGIVIGNRINSKRVGSSEVFPVHGNEKNAKIGGVIGAGMGSVLGIYIANEHKDEGSLLGTIAGSIIGGIGGYFLAEKTIGLSIVLVPPQLAFWGYKIF